MALDIKLPLGPFRDALSTIFGTIFCMTFVSMLAGFIPVVATYWDRISLHQIIPYFLGAWLEQWLIAFLFVWGIPFAIVQLFAFHGLMFGSRDPRFILTIIFSNQMLVSTMTLIFQDDSNSIWLTKITGIICLGFSGWCLWKMHLRGLSRRTM